MARASSWQRRKCTTIITLLFFPYNPPAQQYNPPAHQYNPPAHQYNPPALLRHVLFSQNGSSIEKVSLAKAAQSGPKSRNPS